MTLILAMLLDAGLGEPPWLWSRAPHPAVLMGRAVAWLEQRFNSGSFAMGALVLAGLVLAAWGLGMVLSAFGPLVELVIAAILIAQKSLVQHVQAVGDALRISIGDGRLMVARIVGRDTADMDGSAVARAAIESAAENLSDGVIAPIFWFLIAGLPGLLAYKMVNTADSMIGYRTARYEQFGKAAARFDDLVNWIPARLTAALIALTHGRPDAWQIIRRDAPLHRSPNAGWPEAAMAAVLGIALSGPRAYDGEMRDFPWVNGDGARNLGSGDVDRAVAALWRAWLGMLALVAMAAILNVVV